MADVLLTTDEFNRLKAVVTEAQALRDYLDGVRKTSLRIMPHHIEMPELRGALAVVSDIDLEHPRMSAPARAGEQLTWNENMHTADTKPVKAVKSNVTNVKRRRTRTVKA